jgi:hypothetical protein
MWITNYTLVNQNKNNEMTTCKDSPMFKSMRILKEQIKKLTRVEYCAMAYSIMHSNTCSKKKKHIALTNNINFDWMLFFIFFDGGILFN